jgi:uncharacterized protein DUF4157
VLTDLATMPARRLVPPAPGRVTARSGRALDPGLRTLFESGFGQDFSRVRVHDGETAARAARQLHAHAFTVGDDIFLGAAGAGPRRLAHELAHVVQHRHGGTVAGAEDRAHRAGNEVLRGGRVDAAMLGGRPAGVARDGDDTAGAGSGLRLTVGAFNGFGTGGAGLGPADRGTVRYVAELITTWIRTDPVARFRIVGRTGGGQGAALAAERIRAVAGALIEAGVPATALIPAGAATSGGGAQVEVQVATTGSRAPAGALVPVPPLLGRQAGPAAATPLRTASTTVDRGKEPSPARAADMGDFIGALVKMPEAGRLVGAVGERLSTGLGRATTGEKVVIGTGVAVVAIGVTAGLVESPDLREFALQTLNGKKLPLSLLAERDFRVPIPGTGRHIGFDTRDWGAGNDVLRATTIEFRTQGPGGATGLGFVLWLDLAQLPGAKKGLR